MLLRVVTCVKFLKPRGNFCYIYCYVLLRVVLFMLRWLEANSYQLLDEVEQNITICRCRADQLFADAEGRGK